MNKNHYNVLKSFRFFALILREDGINYVFIGKTAALRFSAVYSKHICGKNSATESYFDKENRPQLYILNEKTLTTAEAYKYVVAYIYLFQQAGYSCINHSSTLDHAQQPKPETLAIIQSLEREPIPSLLSRTRIDNPANADRKPARKELVRQTLIQMNIRIKPEDKIQFDRFKAKHHLNQHETLSLLLDQSDNKHYTDLLAKKDRQIQKLKQENLHLQNKISRQKRPSVPHAEQTAQAFLHFAKEGISIYEDLLPIPMDTTPLPRLSYRFFTKNLLNGLPYEYPTAEGFSILFLEKVLWSNSKTKACFLLGTSQDGHKFKLRYYPKAYHMTCSFLDSKHAYPGAPWLVGYRLAKDQAMELEFAVPLPSIQNEQVILSSPTSASKSEKPSLDAQIKKATRTK